MFGRHFSYKIICALVLFLPLRVGYLAGGDHRGSFVVSVMFRHVEASSSPDRKQGSFYM
jgi:hypothetical protein